MWPEVKRFLKKTLPTPMVHFIHRVRAYHLSAVNPYIDPKNNALHAYRCYNGIVEVVSPVQNHEYPECTELSSRLIQEPGFVCIDNQVFDLRGDGVYRFYRLPVLSEQRIVCKGGVESFLKCAGYLWRYGLSDDAESPEKLEKHLKIRTVSCACVKIAYFASYLMNTLGIEARVVASMSKKDWGGQDDGHTLLEVKINGQWIAYDPTFNVLFSGGGKMLSILDVALHDFSEIQLQNLPGNPGFSSYETPHYNYDFWVMERFLSEDSLRQWYRRILGVPLILSGGRFVASKGCIERESTPKFARFYELSDESAFKVKFYS